MKKIKYHVPISHKETGYVIGYLQLITEKDRLPELEYHLDKEFRNCKIMSQELPRYLDLLKDNKIFKIIAFVKKDNLASQKLLDKNNFVEMDSLHGIKMFAALLNHNKDLLKNLKKDFDIKKIDKLL